MTHTPSHLPPDDPRESDQIGGGWSDDMSSPGPTLDEVTLDILDKLANRKSSVGTASRGTVHEMRAALMEKYPGLTEQEAGEYVVAYDVRENPKSSFQTAGKAATLEKYYTQKPGHIRQWHTTDMMLTAEGEFKHVPLYEREPLHGQKDLRKKVIRMAGGGIAQKQTIFDASRHVGIGRSALRV